MGYEFENIESQIGRLFALDKAKDLDDEESKKILDLVSLGCETATKTFKRLMLSAQDEGHIRRYFHFHQESLTRLIDKTERPENCAAVLVATLRKFLVELLDALRDQFPGYFNCDARMPGFLQQSAISEMTELADSLRAKFNATALDPVLIDIVIEGFNLHEPVSYQKVDYLRYLKERLFVVDISLNDPDLLRQDVCKMLINCNYNAGEFFDYYSRGVKKALINCETLSDRIDLVSWYLKECSQEQCLHEISFNTFRPPIHIQLGEWLIQELDYFK